MRVKFPIISSLAMLLVACGGGGDSAAVQVPVISTFPVESVFASVATTAASYSGASGINTLTISIAPGPAKRFTTNSPESKTYTTSAVLRINGAIAATATNETYFTTGPLSVIGTRAGSDATQVTRQTLLPASAQIGSSGAFFNATKFIGGSTAFTSTVTGSWSLERDTPNTAFLCLTVKDEGIVSTSESDCFKIDSAGTVIGFKVTTTTNARSTNSNPVVDTVTFR